MNVSRRAALIAFIVALLLILGVGGYRAATHKEPRPDTGPASSASAQPR